MHRVLPALLVAVSLTSMAALPLDEHVKQLSAELRCLVCQNQTIADSSAQLAMDLKQQIREQLARGASDQEVIDYMVQRYGDFVLYRPPLKPTTWPLWFGPFAMLLAGLVFLFVQLRHRQNLPDEEESA